MNGNDNKSAAQEAVTWLSKDDAQLALFQAIQAIKLGNPTDDKMILANLREAGLWIGRYAAAPVAAAPVDDDWHLRGYAYASKQATTCAGCNKHKHTPLRIDAMGGYVCLTCIDQKLGSLLGEFGSTPAAPGIDLEQFREAVEHWKRDLHDDYKGGHIHDGGEAMRKAEHLLALIDASPRGGSDAEDTVVYEYRQHYFSNGARGFTWTDWHSITKEQYENRLNNPKPDCELRIRETAMQATSAEVGA